MYKIYFVIENNEHLVTQRYNNMESFGTRVVNFVHRVLEKSNNNKLKTIIIMK